MEELLKVPSPPLLSQEIILESVAVAKLKKNGDDSQISPSVPAETDTSALTVIVPLKFASPQVPEVVTV